MRKTKVLALFTALLLLTGCAAADPGAASAHAVQSVEVSAVPERSTEPDAGASSLAANPGEGAGSTPPESSAGEVSTPLESCTGEVSAPPEPDPDWLLAEHIYSHRGASGYEVEHTFASYDLAIEQGSHNIEQDLVTSADGTLYVSHDESAARIAGVDRDYSDMSDKTIAQLRTANGEGIHSMTEVFERYGRDVNYVVELKQGEEQARAFAALVREYDMEDNVILQSFYPAALEALEGEFPDMPKLYLCRTQEAVNRAVEADYADIVCVKGPLMTEQNLKKVHESGKRFCVYWTGGEAVKTAIQMGADCYFTNYTDTALDLEREYREK